MYARTADCCAQYLGSARAAEYDVVQGGTYVALDGTTLDGTTLAERSKPGLCSELHNPTLSARDRVKT